MDSTCCEYILQNGEMLGIVYDRKTSKFSIFDCFSSQKYLSIGDNKLNYYLLLQKLTQSRFINAHHSFGARNELLLTNVDIIKRWNDKL